MQNKIRWLAALVMGLVVACSGGEPIAAPGPGLTTGQARVASVELNIMESMPVQITAVVRGSLPDGCTEINEVQIGDWADGVLPVTITTVHMQDQPCTEEERDFVEQVSLPVEGLAAGTYTVSVNGVQASLALSVDNVPVVGQGVEPPGDSVLGLCPAPGAGLESYINRTLGYCLLYPTGFEVQEPADRDDTTIIVGAAVEGATGSEPVQASLTISLWGQWQGQPISEVVNEMLAEAVEEFDITRIETPIGGQTAEVVDGLPGRAGSRQAWVVANSQIYHLLLVPIDNALPAVTEEAGALWDAVVGSLVFFPPEDEVGAAPANTGWTAHTFDELGIRIDTPDSWVVSRGAGFYGLASADSVNPNLVTVTFVADAPQELPALRDYVVGGYEARGESGYQQGPDIFNGYPAVLFTGLGDICLDVYLPHEGLVRQITVHQDACVDGVPGDTVFEVLNTVVLYGQGG